MKIAPLIVGEAGKTAEQRDARRNRQEHQDQDGREGHPGDPYSRAALIGGGDDDEMDHDQQQRQDVDVLMDDIHAVQAPKVRLQKARLVGKKDPAGPQDHGAG